MSAKLHNALEAILFVADTPLTAEQLRTALAQTDLAVEAGRDGAVESALDALATRYREQPAGIELRQLGGGVQLLTRPEYADYVRAAVVQDEQKKLSRTVLETLAVVAYQQPVAKSQIDYIRGVDAGYALQKLLERGLIRPSGRADTPGRPLLYATTPAFMAYFGLRSLQDLPRPKELTTDEEALEQLYEKTWKASADAQGAEAPAREGNTPPAEEQPHGTTGGASGEGHPPPEDG